MFTFQFLFGEDHTSLSHNEKYIQGYLNDEQMKTHLYHEVLTDLNESIKEGNIELFNRTISFLDIFTKKEHQLFLVNSFQNLNNPLWKTNIVILCCLYNRPDILELILNNKSNILQNLTVKIGLEKIQLSETDDRCHTAVYYSLQASDTRILDILFTHDYFSNNNDEIECVLSSSFKELKLRSVDVSFQTEVWVQRKLLDLRFFETVKEVEQSSFELLNSIKTRIDILLKAFDKLNQFKSNNDIFINIIKFLSKTLHVLKRFLKSTYSQLPWEEIEFCLVSYIWAYTKNEEICLFYRLFLGKSKILNYLKIFLEKLYEISISFDESNVKLLSVLPTETRENVKKSIIELYPEFSCLYEDFEPIRNIRSLEILKHYLDQASLADVNSLTGRLTITRSFQIIGEHLKNSLESPKLSEYLIAKLIYPSSAMRSIFSSFLSKDARKVIIDVRNTLNHFNSFLDSENLCLFSVLQQDLKKLTTVFVYILYEEKIKMMRNLCSDETIISSDDFENELSLRTIKTDDNQCYDLEIDCINDITQIANEFEKALSQINNENLTFLFQILNRCIGEERNRLTIMKHVYTNCFNNFKLYFCKSSVDKCFSQRNCREVVYLLSKRNLGEFNYYDIILRLSAQIVTTINSCIENSDDFSEAYCKFILGMFTTIVYRVNDVQNTKILWDQIMVHDKMKKKKKKIKTKINKSTLIDTNPTKLSIKLKSIQEQLIALINFGDQNVCFNKEDIPSLEALLLNILSILKDSFKRVSENLLFLDDEVPVLNGNSQRQHLAHINDIFEILDCDPAISTVLNACNFTKDEIRNDISIGKSVKNDSCSFQTFNKHLSILINQNDIREAVVNGDIVRLNDSLKRGGDLNSKIGLTKKSLLHIAARSNNVTMFQYLLDHDLSIFYKDNEGISVVHIAAEIGNEIILKLCLNLGCDLDMSDIYGRTPLHLAAVTGNISIIHFLVENKADINKVCNFGLTPIMYALRRNQLEAIELLVKCNAKISQEEATRELYNCAEIMTEDLLTCLINLGADINNMSDREESTPLLTAVQMRKLNIIKTLLTLGAKSDIRNYYGDTPLHFSVADNQEDTFFYLLDWVEDVQCSNYIGITPLHLASITGNEKILEKLIEKGSNVNSLAKHELSPLHLACFQGNIGIVTILIKNGADIDCECSLMANVSQFINDLYGQKVSTSILKNFNEKTNTRGSKAIFLAAEGGHLKIVELLLNNGCDINEKDSFGNTLLFYGFIYNHKDLITWLINKNIALNEKDLLGRTPIHYATFLGDEVIVNQLLDKGCDINVRDDKQSTPLHYAISARNASMVSYLIGKQADLEAEEYRGLTPLTMAVSQSTFEIIEILLKSGSNIKTCDIHGNSLISYAISKNRRDVLNYLLKEKCLVNSGNKEELILAIMMAESYNFVDTLIKNKADLTISDKNGWTNLHWAAYMNKLDILLLLISKGADVNTKDNNGSQAIHLGAMKGHADIVKALLSAGSNVNSINNNKATPLHLAATSGSRETIEALMNHEADGLLLCVKGFTPLHLAVLSGHSQAIRVILSQNNIDIMDDAGRTALFIAAVKGQTDTVRILIENGACVNKQHFCIQRQIHSLNPLISTIHLGHKDVVKLLLENGALNNLSKKEIYSSLRTAIAKCLKDVVNMIFDFGVNVNIRDNNQSTPLHIACFYGHDEIVHLLTERAASTKSQDVQGFTPIHIAIHEGKTTIVEYLVKNGADLTIKCNKHLTPFYLALLKQNNDIIKILIKYMKEKEHNGLHLAACRGQKEIVSLLLDSGYNVNERHQAEVGETDDQTVLYERTPLHYAVIGHHEETVQLLISRGALVNSKDKEGTAPLHIAAQEGYSNIIQLLLKEGANVNCQTESGETPLHYSACNGHISSIDILLANGAQINSRDNIDCTPLIRSVQFKQLDVLKQLLKNNADIESMDKTGKRSIHFASMNGNNEILKLLIDNGAIIDPIDSKGVAPLRYACQSKQIESAQILIQNNSDVNKKCNSSLTALHYASYLGIDVLVKALVESKADVNCKDNEGTAPLHMAAQNGYETVVAVLLENEADVNIKDNYNVTPLQIALENGHEKIVQKLIGSGAVNEIIETP